MQPKKNKKCSAGRAIYSILTVALCSGLAAVPSWAVDPEVEELERQIRELEAKQREEAERRAKAEAREKAERAAKAAAEAKRKRAAEAAAREEKRRKDAEAAAEAERKRAAEYRRIAAEAEARREAAARAAPDLAGEFVRIEPGCFEMGSPESEEGRDNDEFRHRVCITRAFDLGRYEVTQGQWQRVMGENPSYFSSCGQDCPVETVSWDDVQEFIRKLNARTGLRYRLPTEAEWEYACRSGGKNQKYCGGSDVDRFGWYYDNSGGRTHPVGQKHANGLGLYDMSGNVWEWVGDWYDSDYYARSQRDDPQGPSGGPSAVPIGSGFTGYFQPAYNKRPCGRRTINREEIGDMSNAIGLFRRPWFWIIAGLCVVIPAAVFVFTKATPATGWFGASGSAERQAAALQDEIAAIRDRLARDEREITAARIEAESGLNRIEGLLRTPRGPAERVELGARLEAAESRWRGLLEQAQGFERWGSRGESAAKIDARLAAASQAMREGRDAEALETLREILASIEPRRELRGMLEKLQKARQGYGAAKQSLDVLATTLRIAEIADGGDLLELEKAAAEAFERGDFENSLASWESAARRAGDLNRTMLSRAIDQAKQSAADAIEAGDPAAARAALQRVKELGKMQDQAGEDAP